MQSPLTINTQRQLKKNDENTDSNGMEINSTEGDLASESTAVKQPKIKIHPFYVEIKGRWNELPAKIRESNDSSPLIKMDGGLLKIHCKSDPDFRKTQSYLDPNGFAYITLSPAEQRPRKMVIREITPYTDPQLIIEALKEHNFMASRDAMMKSRKTGRPMPLYVVNVLPKDEFEEIYKINEICYIRVSIERFKGMNIVKQCYHCQKFGHSSEICRLPPKCAKCSEEHLFP